MRLHELSPAAGSRQKPTRKGQGLGSGLGKTAGRGHKGQKARSGGTVRRGFEGGQMPLYRRIPKRGFTNTLREEMAIVNLRDLNRLDAGTEVTPEVLYQEGIVRKRSLKIKLLGKGEIDRPLFVKVHGASKGAVEKVAAAGGKVEVI
ncbi:MAG: 50S ribosomal protein L15 [Thermacetogeniaceae bacterium]